MKVKPSLLLVSFTLLFACKNSNGQSGGSATIKPFDYPDTTAPQFFAQLTCNHYKDFAAVNNDDFEVFCSDTNLSETDSVVKKKFYTIKILHQLFTSKGAKNGSKGAILNIPYYWHWIDPNPRYGITSLKTNQKLNLVKPPKEFAKYKSYADIDRTPYFYLSELLSEKPLYTSSFGEFSTFGWCSEREMAFVCLMELLGFKGQVITDGNHSWSEFIVPFIKNGNTIQLKFKVDNTFDDIEWQPITSTEIKVWQNQKFPGQGNWYNQKAHDATEKQKISALKVSTQAMKNIEDKVVNYLNN